MTTPVESTPVLLTLHAVRIKGMADDDETAARFGLDPTVASEYLDPPTPGRAENERQLAQEPTATDSASSVPYTAFLPNGRLLHAYTDWQLRPSASDPLAANDHTEKGWDQRVLTELSP